jgi:hypothetical protein
MKHIKFSTQESTNEDNEKLSANKEKFKEFTILGSIELLWDILVYFLMITPHLQVLSIHSYIFAIIALTNVFYFSYLLLFKSKEVSTEIKRWRQKNLFLAMGLLILSCIGIYFIQYRLDLTRLIRRDPHGVMQPGSLIEPILTITIPALLSLLLLLLLNKNHQY